MPSDNEIPNLVDRIIRYEDGEMTDDETVDFFQELVDSGLAWRLQGSYGRMVEALIRHGKVTWPRPRPKGGN